MVGFAARFVGGHAAPGRLHRIHRLLMEAIKSAMSCGVRVFSKPSGMKESRELVSSFMSPRRIVSSVPPALRRVTLFGVSTAMIPLISRSLFVMAV